MFPIQLQTPRLFIREFNAADVDAVHVYSANPLVSQYQIWGPNSLEETQAFVTRAMESQSKKLREAYEMAAILKSNHQLIGGGGITLDSSGSRIASIGYTFAPEFWGQGLATELAQALIDFGFDSLNCHRIWATCRTENSRSARVLEKCGMIREGHLRKNMFVRGEWKDSWLYAQIK
jgi:ribosomal-protein-alanine N-acetyltransferase